jgi:hypothetical protein
MRVAAHLEVPLKFPTIAIVATAATFFAASLLNAEPAPRRGHNAYGFATPLADTLRNGPPDARASALRECNTAVANVNEGIWGIQRSTEYRTCMATHGQME